MFLSRLVRAKLLIIFLCVIILWIPFYFYMRKPYSRTTDVSKEVPILSPELLARLDAQRLPISVYYETLCPDSRSFVEYQLDPAFTKFSRYLKLDLIPYGKATTKEVSPGNYEFTCQHGEVECQGNIYHACTIDLVPNEATQLKMVKCMINDNINPEEIAKTCSAKYGVAFEGISSCAQGPKGRTLLKQYGDRTKKLWPHVSFIPTVLIDGDFGDQVKILKNLSREICNYFRRMVSQVPPECQK